MLYFAVAAMFLAVFFGIVAVGRYFSDQPTRDQKRAAARLRELSRPAEAEMIPLEDRRRGFADAVVALGAWLTARDKNPTSGVGARLLLAGYRQPSAALYFLGLQLILVVVFTLLCGVVAILFNLSWTKVLLIAAGGGAFGLLVPSLVLSSQIKKRQKKLRAGLPDAIDIMVLCVEGGASLNAAINWVTQEIHAIHPELGAEMVIVEREIQLGLTPGEAFRSFADRCGLPEVRDMTAALLQSERYGASVAKALRAYADAARQDRQVWAEEVAQKAAVKIMFPMLLCIFPAMFIVLLGPAAMQMSRLFVK
ncbi:type II secretion system F family protein [Limnoglobus roseus]|uniref:Type II secretion system F family protein n=1 Tax=Limnoglobus roseus TaxID=2598579 RepID=A0A5C1AQW9_9BACT|nr:type II secretion system F family protein [Limnoglobus roseus]QEL21015.1 type II secretion system F family protein [Limnoglobus roseus]